MGGDRPRAGPGQAGRGGPAARPRAAGAPHEGRQRATDRGRHARGAGRGARRAAARGPGAVVPRNVLVVGELNDGAPSATTRELLGAACGIAASGEVGVVLLGAGASAAAPACAGATRAYTSDDAEYDAFRGDQWLRAIVAALDLGDADLVLIAQSTAGRELGPRLAQRRGTAVAMDCTQVVDDGGTWRATRPAYGGNAIATYTFATRPAIATVRPKSFAAVEGDGPATITALPGAGESRTRIVSREPAAAEGLRLEDARVVVSGGRGLGAADGFALLQQLVDTIGRDRAVLGASRAAVDLGWCAQSMQVGLTGRVVAPDLYIAVGISGASQHMSGCSGARTIIAINRDADASIMDFARYGVIGDYKQIVPELIAALRGG
ncbi:MAG: electron transfer flavoprotein subunit alpha/FixB family protein [Dehalococcoidia bacterium]|nr:electron transfer flavoprotein subunit alpha/FixB family protein [Dehalococcoidia bacterium]